MTMSVTSSLTKMQITAATGSISASATYLRRLIPIATFNIIYNRINYPEKFFDNHVLGTCHYKTMAKKGSSQSSNPLLKTYLWMEEAMKCVERKCLETFLFIIHDKKDDKIIEFFRFEIKYNEDPDAIQLYMKEDILAETVTFLETLQSFSNFNKLDHENIKINFQIVLKKKGFVPTYFRQCDGDDPTIINTRDISGYAKLGRLMTGYHKVSILAKGKAYDLESTKGDHENTGTEKSTSKRAITGSDSEKPSKKQYVSSDITEISQKRSEIQFDLDETYPSIIEDDDKDMTFNEDIGCLCDIKYNINATKLIKCHTCNKYEHLACLGIISQVDAQENNEHKCTRCQIKEGIESSNDPYIQGIPRTQNKTIVKIIRLLTVYCGDTRKRVESICDKVPMAERIRLYTHLLKTKIILEYNGGYKFNHAVLGKDEEWFFYTYFYLDPSSEVLQNTQESSEHSK